MGKGGGGSAPPAPDPAATARAQSQANRETAIAQAQINMINQNTPFGRLEYTQRGTAPDGTPQYTATQTLSPQQQAISDEQQAAALAYGQTGNQLMGRVRNMLGTPVDISSFGAAPTYDNAFRDAQRDALLTRMQPQIDRARAALETRLANQGIGAGSAAWQTEMDQFQRGLTDMRLAADIQAGNVAGQEYGRMRTARNDLINEAYLPRTQEQNALAALLSGAQVQGPQFVNTPQTQVGQTDVMGPVSMQYQGQLADWNARNQAAQATQGGLFGLLGTGAQAAATFWSDRRLKTDIRKIGKRGPYNWYSYRYIWGERAEGVMADEVEKINPAAVSEIHGFKAVNYGAL